MRIDISYILREDVLEDELPVRLSAFAKGDNIEPACQSAGIDLDAALGPIRRFSGIGNARLMELIYK